MYTSLQKLMHAFLGFRYLLSYFLLIANSLLLRSSIHYLLSIVTREKTYNLHLKGNTITALLEHTSPQQ